MDIEEKDNRPMIRIGIGVGVLIFLGLCAWAWSEFGGSSSSKASFTKPSVVSVSLPPLPPPPPPPPPPPRERPPEQQMQQETKFVPQEAEEAPSDAPPDDSPANLGTGIVGDGPPDGFGLGTRGGGGRFGGIGGGSGPGSKFGAYAGKIQRSIADTLRTHKKTRSASLMVKVRIWADTTGRVTRVSLSGTTGDAQLDRTLRDEVLTGMQLPEPPPEGMPMPIVMRITAQRP